MQKKRIGGGKILAIMLIIATLFEVGVISYNEACYIYQAGYYGEIYKSLGVDKESLKLKEQQTVLEAYNSLKDNIDELNKSRENLDNTVNNIDKSDKEIIEDYLWNNITDVSDTSIATTDTWILANFTTTAPNNDTTVYNVAGKQVYLRKGVTESQILQHIKTAINNSETNANMQTLTNGLSIQADYSLIDNTEMYLSMAQETADALLLQTRLYYIPTIIGIDFGVMLLAAFIIILRWIIIKTDQSISS